MEVLAILIPVTLFLGFLALGAFFWTMRTRQYEDPRGDANRILTSDFDERPKQDLPPKL